MIKIKWYVDGNKTSVLALFLCIYTVLTGILVHSDIIFFSFSSDKPAVSAVFCVHVIKVTAGTCYSECVLVHIKMSFQNYAYSFNSNGK